MPNAAVHDQTDLTISPRSVGHSCSDMAKSGRESGTHKFIRDVCFSNLPAPFQKLRTYLWLVVMTRTLGAEGFGAWSLFVVTLSIATTFATLNCGASLMRFLSGERTPGEVNRAWSTVLAMVGGAALILIVLFLTFPKYLAEIIFRSQRDNFLVAVLGLALLCDCVFEEMKNLLRARRKNKLWAIFSVAKLVPEIVATIVVAWLFRTVLAVGFAYVAIGFSGVVAGTMYLGARQKIRLVRPSPEVFRKYSSFGLPLLPGVLASAISFGADKYLVNYYLGLRQAGIYSACFTIAAATFFLVGPINDVLFPELSALHDTEKIESFDQRFSGIQRFVLGLSAGAAALLTAFPRQILKLLSSSAFASGGKTLAILGVQGIFMAVVLLYIVVLNVQLRVISSTLFWIVSGGAILVLDMLLIPGAGIVGAAISQLICTAAGAIFLIAVHWNLFKRTFAPAWLLQVGVGFAAVCAFGMFWPVRSDSAATSLAQIFLGACIFLLSLFATGYADARDVNLIRKAFYLAPSGE
jgi:O-antigen/teichoic acid export membrane protein